MRRRYGRPLGVAAVLGVGWWASPAAAALPQQLGNVDLLTQADIRIDGPSMTSGVGYPVASAGDVNGDGIDDVLLTASGAGNNDRLLSGSVYVVFGSATPRATVDLADLGAAGYRIDGALPGDQAGMSAAGVGDVNGDGLDDVLVGAPAADVNGRTDSGSAYVVFGTRHPANVDLQAPGGDAYRIDGVAAKDETGLVVAAAGDVNGDGHADLAITAMGAGNNARFGSGSVYVVFGTATATNVDLASSPWAGYRIDGASLNGHIGSALADVGDVNGDGRPDLAIGDPRAADNNRSDSGSVTVVFGTAQSGSLDLAHPDERGYRIDGPIGLGYAGASVAGAGDVNGDGHADLVLGAPGVSAGGRQSSGAAFVVFGKGSKEGIDLAALGRGGYRVDGPEAGDSLGTSVAGVGDVNGDGRPDLALGAQTAGAVFVPIYPASTPEQIAYIIRGFTEEIRNIVAAHDRARFDRCHLMGFGESALQFEISYVVLAPDYATHVELQQAINLAIIERFGAMGVEFAYPTRTVMMETTPGAAPPPSAATSAAAAPARS